MINNDKQNNECNIHVYKIIKREYQIQIPYNYNNQLVGVIFRFSFGSQIIDEFFCGDYK